MEGAPIPGPFTGHGEPMWQSALAGGRGGAGEAVYPERPDEPNCDYYMRTGKCGYGDRCRYNHPRNRASVAAAGRSGGEYPERVGLPECRYFLKTGTCKFGATCKYHHPRRGGSVLPVQLNSHGFPLRLGQRECAYYMKTGNCKFGVTCKFHHPESDGTSMPASAPPFYPMAQSPSVNLSHQFPAMASWQVPRPVPTVPGSYVEGAYGPLMFTPGVVPMPGWSLYQPSVNPVGPPGSHHGVETGSPYGMPYQLLPSTPAYLGPYQPVSSSAGPSSSGQNEFLFPERPGQPECRYYMETGDCKFGTMCRYHHPPERNTPNANYFLNPMGLPLRPGAPVCTFYMQHGMCRFGPSCKFDHPMGTWSYNPSLPEMPFLSFSSGPSVATMAPSSSSTELQHEFTAGTSNNDSFATQMPSSGNVPGTSSGSTFVGAMVSQSYVPTPILSSSSTISSQQQH